MDRPEVRVELEVDRSDPGVGVHLDTPVVPSMPTYPRTLVGERGPGS